MSSTENIPLPESNLLIENNESTEIQDQDSNSKRKLEEVPDSEPDKNGAIVKKPNNKAKRQKFNYAGNYAASTFYPTPYRAAPYPLAPLEPAELPKGEPTTVSEFHAVVYKDKFPEEVDLYCCLTSCEICYVYLRSEEAARMHYFGPSHKKNISRYMISLGYRPPTRRLADGLQPDQDPKFCQICQTSLVNEGTALDHYSGKNHAKKFRQAQAKEKALATDASVDSEMTSNDDSELVPENGDSSQNGKTGKLKIFYCLPCKENFTEEEDYTTHNGSDAHKAKCIEIESGPSIDELLGKVRTDPNSPFECSLCNVTTPNENQMRMHLDGKVHKMWLEEKSKNPDFVLPHPQPSNVASFRCEYCQVNCTDLSTLDLHMKGKKHSMTMSGMALYNRAPAQKQYRQRQYQQPQFRQQYQQPQFRQPQFRQQYQQPQFRQQYQQPQFRQQFKQPQFRQQFKQQNRQQYKQQNRKQYQQQYPFQPQQQLFQSQNPNNSFAADFF